MIVDFAEAGEAVLDGRAFDVCIAGAGPAGITLATNLSRNLSVLLLEAGGLEPSEDSQQIYKGTVTGRDYYELDTCRIRCFGGTSNHWAGMCQALEDIDFQPRPYVAYSGWPIRKTDLDPYFERAAGILDIDLAHQDPPRFRARLDQGLGAGGFVRPFRFLWSPPTRFGTKFQSPIAESRNITCLLRANLTDILLDESGTTARAVEITGYDGTRATVAARRVVVAAGGIENARILLNCNKQVKVGLGNQHDLVGRFFTEHPEHRCGWLVLQDDLRDAVLDEFSNAEMSDWRNSNFYAAGRKFAHQEETLNFCLIAILRPYARDRRFSFRQRVREAICAPDWLSEALDSVFDEGAPKCHDGTYKIAIEQAPNPDSRITLGDDKDQFGWRRIVLDWRLLPIGKRTISVAATQFATHFAAHDLGRVRVKEWILADDAKIPELGKDDAAGYHHMGTTRMAGDPRHGVVDGDCRIHGIRNLYIAGSSVFPTAGFVNPTFTIVQLSLRLADHLNSS